MVIVHVKDKEDPESEDRKALFITEADIEQFSSGDYLDIWKVNPSYKDIHNIISYGKAIFLVLLIAFSALGAYTFNSDIKVVLGIGIFVFVIFLISFHDQFFSLPHLFSFTFRKHVKINPFADFMFWTLKNEKTTIFCSSRNDLVHIGVRIFQIKIIPENVHATLNHFIRAFSGKDTMIPFTYQVVNMPLYDVSQDVNRHIKKASGKSLRTCIYFCIYHSVKGILSENKLNRLAYKLKEYELEFISNFAQDFHHFKISLLAERDLVNALRLFYFRGVSYPIAENTYDNNKIPFLVYFKVLFCCTLIIYFNFILFSWDIQLYLIILANFALLGIIVYLWWKGLIFTFSIRYLRQDQNYVKIHPFNDVKFYYFRRHPDSIFLHINNQLLVNTKISNVNYATPPFYFVKDKYSQASNKYTIAEITLKVPFTYTVINTPIPFYEFDNEGSKYLTPKTEYLLFRSKHGIRSARDEVQWLNNRAGIWRSILLTSTSNYRFADTLKIQYVDELEQELQHTAHALDNAFKNNFRNIELVRLQRNKLLSGYICEVLKNSKYRLNGTHTNYLLFQGKTLIKFIEISDGFKKGVATRLGAEFNTPLYLENFITIGHAFNTEIYDNEVPAGFTLKQLNNLFITNGTSKDREDLAIKIVSEGIKADQSFLIFDFHGTWSKLLTFFKDSQYEDDILYFKFGSAFTVDPLRSDIPYDQNNIEYQEYMFDAYGLAFRKDKRTVDLFRNTITRNPEMDFSSLNLEIKSQSEWERHQFALQPLFSDFLQQDLTLFHKSEIHSTDFITTAKTVIIDLSIWDSLNKKLFVAFLILSKIIHHIRHSENFHAKIIKMPYSDIFFDSFYLERRSDYGKIDTYLRPLLQHGFGFIFSANQVHYLHPHIFNYFSNILAFKSIDSRDIAALRNVMNLQELVGSGYYSSTRNQLYQLNYLMTLLPKQVLVKRSDIFQSFPYEIAWDEIQNAPYLSYEQIVDHMERQGYDLQDAQRKLLEQAKKTLFEIDLGIYAGYLPEVVSYLSALSRIDQVGNLYMAKLKKELKNYIAPKALKRNIPKENINKLRDKILEILIKQGYLKEGHPRKASGSQSIRTSYIVGEQYDRAVDDYFQTKGKIRSDVVIEILEKESPTPDTLKSIFQEQPRKFIIKKGDLKEALAREFSDFYYKVFKIYSYIRDKKFEHALKLEHTALRQFLVNVYKHMFHPNYVISSKDLDGFLDSLEKEESFPYTTNELKDHFDKFKIITFEEGNLEAKAYEIYEFIYQFSIKIQNYMYGGNNEQ